jgi:hypothetical protein
MGLPDDYKAKLKRVLIDFGHIEATSALAS